MRFLDTVSGYMFIISAGNGVDPKKMDGKLDQIYKSFVDYVIKAPFFNVPISTLRPQKKSITPFSSKNATKSYILFDHKFIQLFSFLSDELYYFNDGELTQKKDGRRRAEKLKIFSFWPRSPEKLRPRSKVVRFTQVNCCEEIFA